MALNLAVVKRLPLRVGDFFKSLQNKSAGSGAASVTGMSGSFRQLYLQIVAFILFAALSFWVINQVRVNGPVYNNLKQYQNLVADALPPPLYPVDAFAFYNQAYVASTNFNNDKRDKAIANAAKFENLFKERATYWQKNITNEKPGCKCFL